MVATRGCDRAWGEVNLITGQHTDLATAVASEELVTGEATIRQVRTSNLLDTNMPASIFAFARRGDEVSPSGSRSRGHDCLTKEWRVPETNGSNGRFGLP